MDPIAGTARWTAAVRARESERADRLFDDPLASILAGAEGFAQLERQPPERRDNLFLAIRTRFFDDWLQRLTRESPIRQVVLVGAGMDARAFRLGWDADVTIWEVDRPSLLGLKRNLLMLADIRPACQRRVVGADVRRDDWPDRLEGQGFRRGLPSVWLAEGLFVYLQAAAAQRLLTTIRDIAAPGSYLGADLVSEDFFHSQWTGSDVRRLEEQHTPWRFGTNDPEALLDRHGWQAAQVVQPGEPGADHRPLPWPLVPRSVPGVPRMFFVTAVRE